MYNQNICENCGRKIIYLPTGANIFVPTEFESLNYDDLQQLKNNRFIYYREDEHVAHILTCREVQLLRYKDLLTSFP